MRCCPSFSLGSWKHPCKKEWIVSSGVTFSGYLFWPVLLLVHYFTYPKQSARPMQSIYEKFLSTAWVVRNLSHVCSVVYNTRFTILALIKTFSLAIMWPCSHCKFTDIRKAHNTNKAWALNSSLIKTNKKLYWFKTARHSEACWTWGA